MFNVSRFFDSLCGRGVRPCMCACGVCVCACVHGSVCVRRRDPVCVSLSFLRRLSLLFCSRYLCLTHKEGAFVAFLNSLYPFFFFSSSAPPPLWCRNCVADYLLCPQGESQLTLYANIHSAIISNVFHTHFEFHSV